MTQVIVRPATPADHAETARVTLAAYRGDRQVTPGHPYEPVLADVAGRAGAGELLVAEDPDTGSVVGSVLFVLPGSRYAEVSGPGEAELRTLAVDPPAQGRGVGKALARACLARATDLGCRAVVISTRDFATDAHRLYRRLGFVRIPERDWAPLPDVHLFAWRLELSPAPGTLPTGGAR